MSFVSITDSTVAPYEKYVDKEWVKSTEANFFKKHVLARGAYLVLAPCYAISCALDAIIGLGAALGSICTLGLYKPALKSAEIHLNKGTDILLYPYSNLLKAINPAAKFQLTIKGPSYLERKLDLLIDNTISKPLNFAVKCANSDNLLKRQVVSRLTFALITVSALVNGVATSIFGMPAVVLSFLTFGKFSSINRIAQLGAATPAVVLSIYVSVLGVINPQVMVKA